MNLDVHKTVEEKMKKTISVYKEDLQSIRAGRANTSLLDKITVDYYGQMTPLIQVASVSAPEPRLLTIQPWDLKLIPVIEKAILVSDLGINPTNDGKIIRLQIPQLTEERRKDLIKVVKKNGENAKISVRNLRRDGIDAIKKMEKSKDIDEDERRNAEEKMQKITDKFIEEIDSITKNKEDELLEI
ncbi:ribosome recycling factor [Tissierella creatinophila]|uniref:Ribosome-recycling factor n=1 Tax=Tissierella creatinophila DSM 6911 TaxID=1123403 RepID=A0A1U7M356_TISCR|nr:ribosome recycling factor [Tissierella creatinophila]OLS01753.1 ribosome-recycling factor [Tissierella creatinophila DSM 6911]